VLWDESRLYIVLEYLDQDLRQHIDSGAEATTPENVKVNSHHASPSLPLPPPSFLSPFLPASTVDLHQRQSSILMIKQLAQEMSTSFGPFLPPISLEVDLHSYVEYGAQATIIEIVKKPPPPLSHPPFGG